MLNTFVNSTVEAIQVPVPVHRLLSEKQIDGIERIRAYTFNNVREKLVAEGSIPNGKIDAAVEEFRKFLILILLYPDKPIGMTSKIVDEVWHTFILFTREYMTFTQSVFGSFLHHNPATSSKPLDNSSGVNFRESYRAVFGELPSIWKNSSHDCDSGDSGDAGDDVEVSAICQGGNCNNDPIACRPMADAGETSDSEEA